MGKYSNIILTDENWRILDSIKHVSHDKSSVKRGASRRWYVFPPSQDKYDPMKLDFERFKELAEEKDRSDLASFYIKVIQE